MRKVSIYTQIWLSLSTEMHEGNGLQTSVSEPIMLPTCWWKEGKDELVCSTQRDDKLAKLFVDPRHIWANLWAIAQTYPGLPVAWIAAVDIYCPDSDCCMQVHIKKRISISWSILYYVYVIGAAFCCYMKEIEKVHATCEMTEEATSYLN